MLSPRKCVKMCVFVCVHGGGHPLEEYLYLKVLCCSFWTINMSHTISIDCPDYYTHAIFFIKSELYDRYQKLLIMQLCHVSPTRWKLLKPTTS